MRTKDVTYEDYVQYSGKSNLDIEQDAKKEKHKTFTILSLSQSSSGNQLPLRVHWGFFHRG